MTDSALFGPSRGYHAATQQQQRQCLTITSTANKIVPTAYVYAETLFHATEGLGARAELVGLTLYCSCVGLVVFGSGLSSIYSSPF